MFVIFVIDRIKIIIVGGGGGGGGFVNVSFEDGDLG